MLSVCCRPQSARLELLLVLFHDAHESLEGCQEAAQEQSVAEHVRSEEERSGVSPECSDAAAAPKKGRQHTEQQLADVANQEAFAKSTESAVHKEQQLDEHSTEQHSSGR